MSDDREPTASSGDVSIATTTATDKNVTGSASLNVADSTQAATSTSAASPQHAPQYVGAPTGAPAVGYEHDPNAFGAYYPTFPVQSYPMAPQAYYSDAGMSPVAYAQTPPLGPTGSVSPFPSQSPYLAPVGNPGAAIYQSPSTSPSGSATAAQYYFYSQNHTSPFLQPVQMSPTLSAISSAPSSPRLSGCPSPTPSFNGGNGRNYARSNVSRHQDYDMFLSIAGSAAAAQGLSLTTNVYIRGLPATTTDEGLHAMCAA
jgi:hypothetical protein